MRLHTSTLILLLFFVVGGLNAAIVVPAVTPATEAAAPSETELADIAREYRASLKAMSAHDRRELKREQRRALKDALQHRRDTSEDTLLLVIICIFIPPLAVFLHQGEINSKFWISLLLTLLFYVPGLIYSLITILG